MQCLGDAAVVKRLSDTCWEAHARATAAVLQGYAAIVDALSTIHDDDTQKGDARSEAETIKEKVGELEFVIMLEFWDNVLQRFKKTSATLQNQQISLSTCAKLYSSLLEYVNRLREQFNDFETKAMNRLIDVQYRAANKRRLIRRKQVNDGAGGDINDGNEQLNSSYKCRITYFIPIVDVLVTNLFCRASIYKKNWRMSSIVSLSPI